MQTKAERNARQRAYYEKNRERCLIRQKEYAEQHTEEIKAQKKGMVSKE